MLGSKTQWHPFLVKSQGKLSLSPRRSETEKKRI